MSKKKLIDLMKDVQGVDIPFHVSRIFTGDQTRLEPFGDQVCMNRNGDCDYASVSEVRQALEWYIDQMGGSVIWKKL